LIQIVGRHDFIWNWLSVNGQFGGIHLGIKHVTVEVDAFHQGDYFVSTLLMNKKVRFKWEVIVVYGPTHHEV
jgi:hypothetical protein